MNNIITGSRKNGDDLGWFMEIGFTIYSVPTNRPEPTNTNRNEPPGYGTGKWKRTAGTEPKFCGNRTENHSYIEISYVKLCENISIYTFLTPSFPSFPGLRIINIAEQLSPRNLYCNGKIDQRM